MMDRADKTPNAQNEVETPMTTAPARPPMPSRPPMGGPGGPAPQAGTPTIDPVRLLRKYKLVLAAAVVLGVAIGVGAHFAFLYTIPKFESFVLYEMRPVKQDAGERQGQYDEEELERFMQTEAAKMTSDRVLQATVERPELRTEAAGFLRPFLDPNGAVNFREARLELEDLVRAGVIPETQFVRLSVRTANPEEAFTLTRLLREEYESVLSGPELNKIRNQQDAIQRTVQQLDTEIRDLQQDREDILRENGIDSLDSRTSEASGKLNGVNATLTEVGIEIQSFDSILRRMQTQASSPAGPQYDDELRANVESQPLIQNLKQMVASLESELRSRRGSGMGDAHPEMRKLRAELEAQRSTLELERARALEQLFFGQIQSASNVLESLRAQEADLLDEQQRLKERLTELTNLTARVNDIQNSIDEKRRQSTERRSELDNLRALESQALARDQFDRPLFLERVVRYQTEQVADEPSFPPKLIIMAPLGAFLVTGLVGGLIVLRELLDQRIKGPADISMIPRATLLGMIPGGTEDPGKPKAVELAFRDNPRGALAEQFRQIRSPLLTKLEQAGHRTVCITAGMPDSGTTTVVTNLGFALAASGKRVLMLDANMRRPRLHSVLGVADAPGLADVLARTAELESALTPVTEGLDLMPVGSRSERVYERLGSSRMAEVLAEASRSFDIVLIDTPPLVVSGDAMGIANLCDASVLVVRALSEKRGMVSRLRGELADARADLLGILVNGVRASAGGYLRSNMRATHDYHNEQR